MSDGAGQHQTAGALLRAAREGQGLHIAALAASIKVPQRKLEALEGDRHAELLDTAFARALAHAVCRRLKIDARPVLALLPVAGDGHRLERTATGLNAPFHDRPGRHDPSRLAMLQWPVAWAAVLVLMAAGVLAILPDQAWRHLASAAPAQQSVVSAATPPTATSRASTGAPPAAATIETSEPTQAPTSLVEPAPIAAAAVPGAAAMLRANGQSWVEARDSSGRLLLSRTLQPGETIGLEGSPPLRLKIGNARVTELSFRGRPVDLSPLTASDNVARVELE
jgi:cytoskeleton protein RodZ